MEDFPPEVYISKYLPLIIKCMKSGIKVIKQAALNNLL